MKKHIFLIGWMAVSALFTAVNAQNELDAMRYSSYGLFGSARTLGTGGAFSAVGADLSSGVLNPAGFALYRFSEGSMTPMLSFNVNQSAYLNTQSKADANPFTLNNIGYTWVKGGTEEEENNVIRAMSFSFGYNMLQNYNSDIVATAYNDNSSITDYFVQTANGTPEATLNQVNNINSYANLAYVTYAIDTLNGQTNAYMPAFNNGRLQQTIDLNRTGNRGEYHFALALNIKEKLYIGAKIGNELIRYSQDLQLVEEDINRLHETYQNNPNAGPLSFPTKRIYFNDYFNSKGKGYNYQLGVIFRPIDNFRIGASFKVGANMSITDDFGFRLQHTQNRIQDSVLDYSSTKEGLQSTYTLKTPNQITLGAMYLFNKHGFISADADIIDYSKARLASTEPITSSYYYGYTEENRIIRDNARMSVNLRFGGEWRINNFRIRGGYARFQPQLKASALTYQNPNDLSQQVAYNPTRTFITGGLGYRVRGFYLDLAYIHQASTDIYRPYVLKDPAKLSPTTVNKIRNSSVAMTIGINM